MNNITIKELVSMSEMEGPEDEFVHSMIKDCNEKEFLEWLLRIIVRPDDEQEIIDAVGLGIMVRYRDVMDKE